MQLRAHQFVAFFSFLLITAIISAAHAENALSGGQTILIQNSRSSCIVPSQSAVSITITSVRVPSDAPWPTWLKKAKGVGAKVDLNITGPSGTSEHASFPVGKLVSQLFPDNTKPIIRATLNIAVLSKYRLANSEGNYARIDMPLTLVKIDDNSGMKSLIQSLSKISQSIKIPPSPFETGVQAFGTLVSDLFTANSSSKDEYPNAVLGFELIDDESECTTNEQALRTGAQAQLFTSPKSGDGIIDIGEYANYCYYSSGGPDPNILYSQKNAAAKCDDAAPAASKTLNNPQVIFVVNAYPLSPLTKSAAVAVQPETLAAVTKMSSEAARAFSAFSSETQRQTAIASKRIDSKDALSLQNKLSGSKSAVQTKIELNPIERGTLELVGALTNCNLVGLDATTCN